MIELGDNMAKVVKKKVKIKKKNFAIFIAFIMVFTFAVTQIIFIIFKVITTPKEIEKEKPQTEIKKEPKKKVLTEEEEKLKKLNNINEKLTYFKMDNLDRYINYKEDNPEKSDEQIIKDVNMNLDKEPYEDAVKATNLNNNLILVNKYNYLENDYVPNNLKNINRRYALNDMKLVQEAKNAFEDLSSDAAKENLKIVVMSSYRSYDYQVNLYNRYAQSDGKEKADTYSGRAGFSEHQTGLAIDVYDQELNYTSFEKTNEFKWMQNHAHEYGFILRFPKGKEEETGYIYESWHYRYVGKEVAKYIKENDITLEEYIATH